MATATSSVTAVLTYTDPGTKQVVTIRSGAFDPLTLSEEFTPLTLAWATLPPALAGVTYTLSFEGTGLDLIELASQRETAFLQGTPNVSGNWTSSSPRGGFPVMRFGAAPNLDALAMVRDDFEAVNGPDEAVLTKRGNSAYWKTPRFLHDPNRSGNLITTSALLRTSALSTPTPGAPVTFRDIPRGYLVVTEAGVASPPSPGGEWQWLLPAGATRLTLVAPGGPAGISTTGLAAPGDVWRFVPDTTSALWAHSVIDPDPHPMYLKKTELDTGGSIKNLQNAVNDLTARLTKVENQIAAGGVTPGPGVTPQTEYQITERGEVYLSGFSSLVQFVGRGVVFSDDTITVGSGPFGGRVIGNMDIHPNNVQEGSIFRLDYTIDGFGAVTVKGFALKVTQPSTGGVVLNDASLTADDPADGVIITY